MKNGCMHAIDMDIITFILHSQYLEGIWIVSPTCSSPH
jgi:hypothetical protein